ncbi:hypothetical protein [Bacillus cereus]|uniref:hypothetical protein n=1 Tax=Bacillus cereus TaxID=1396 RepID=UPI002404D2F0|nr:hypothetical protein [Bacillus cereus]MDF9529498.1 hypothetical protein [Bacillus cereus]MDG1579054.1 hypothetical protein [Bacillus cereus]
MYNNYWNPNQDVMYPNAVPNVDSQYYYSLGSVPGVDPNYRMVYQNATSSEAPNVNSNYQFSQSIVQDTFSGYRDLTLTANQSGGIDIGNGFRLFSFEPARPIASGQYLTIFLNAPELRVINAGWKVGGAPAKIFAIESFARHRDQWVITLYNDDSVEKMVTFSLIAKLPR